MKTLRNTKLKCLRDNATDVQPQQTDRLVTQQLSQFNRCFPMKTSRSAPRSVIRAVPLPQIVTSNEQKIKPPILRRGRRSQSQITENLLSTPLIQFNINNRLSMVMENHSIKSISSSRATPMTHRLMEDSRSALQSQFQIDFQNQIKKTIQTLEEEEQFLFHNYMQKHHDSGIRFSLNTLE